MHDNLNSYLNRSAFLGFCALWCGGWKLKFRRLFCIHLQGWSAWSRRYIHLPRQSGSNMYWYFSYDIFYWISYIRPHFRWCKTHYWI